MLPLFLFFMSSFSLASLPEAKKQVSWFFPPLKNSTEKGWLGMGWGIDSGWGKREYIFTGIPCSRSLLGKTGSHWEELASLFNVILTGGYEQNTLLCWDSRGGKEEKIWIFNSWKKQNDAMNVTEMDVAEWPLYSRGRSRYITNCLLTILHVKIGGGG